MKNQSLRLAVASLFAVASVIGVSAAPAAAKKANNKKSVAKYSVVSKNIWCC